MGRLGKLVERIELGWGGWVSEKKAALGFGRG
jgi:hypothetical protein